MRSTSVPLLSRIWLSWLTSIRILFDGRFAAKVARLGDGQAQQEPARPAAAPVESQQTTRKEATQASANAALQLLTLLQREGRFVDFVQQEIATFSDADIGAAARVVHEGCRRAIRAH